MDALQRWQRWWRHVRLDRGDIGRALDAPALARLQAAVADSERRHTGQIRMSVEASLPLSYLQRGLGSRERANMLFGKLRVWDTAYNNGVLIYLLLADRAIEIVADRGLTGPVPQAQWDTLVAGMRLAFAAGRFEAGLLEAVAAVDRLLQTHCPRVPGQAQPNELPDEPDLR